MNFHAIFGSKLAALASMFLLSLTLPCVAADPIGYAWPKNDLLITNTTPSRFKSLKEGGTYPLIVKLESGYSIVCEGADGQKTAALLPLKDRFGNPLNIQRAGNAVSVSSGYVLFGTVVLENVGLKPGVIPLGQGQRYTVGELAWTSLFLVRTAINHLRLMRLVLA